MGTDAVLSRMEDQLRQDDLAGGAGRSGQAAVGGCRGDVRLARRGAPARQRRSEGLAALDATLRPATN